MNPNRYVYHITTKETWQGAQPGGWYKPPAYATDKFIHCSTLQQVVPVAERLYAGQTGLVLLQIWTNRLAGRLVYENLEGGAVLYPHIYGALNLDAVSQVVPFQPGPDGHFALPNWLEAECPG
ncbi:MAG: DUF952 domain-containing protein [Anaerolineaceae bacterium]|nr:DUF952 domain-containing protein [Anaerolineaceae bacterium]